MEKYSALEVNAIKMVGYLWGFFICGRIYECAMVAWLKGICRLKKIAAFILFGADTQSSVFDTIY